MSKIKLGVYYDLPAGGASRLMNELIDHLGDRYDFVELPHLVSSPNRLVRDRQNFFDCYRQAFSLRPHIRSSGIDALLVCHDAFFAAPAILVASPVPTLLYCQEPTRALFEPELGIDSSLPLKNRLYEKMYRTLKRVLESYNASRATRIMANSGYAAEYIKHAYNQKATVLYPGIDTNVFSLKAQSSKLKPILLVGNDEPQKRLSLAIRAVGLIPPSLRPPLILVCPRRKPSAALINLSKRHGVKLTVHIGISDRALVSLYQHASLTLISALREPFGLSAAESLACGTPVIATNEGGVREIIEDGVTGYLTDDTPEALALGMRSILEHPTRGRQMGLAGHAHILQHFTWAKCVSSFESILKSLLPIPAEPPRP